jgi:hypothetical protein
VDSTWWRVVPSIWTECFSDELDRVLELLGERSPRSFHEGEGESDEHYALSYVLRDIPPEAASQHLIKHWSMLKYSRRFIQVALYIGGDELLHVVRELLDRAPDDWDPFRFVGDTFGFKSIGLRDRLTNQHIDALLPYISQLGDTALVDIAEWLSEHKRDEDITSILMPEIRRRSDEHQDEGEGSFICRMQRLRFPSDADLLNGLSECETNETNVWRWTHYATERGDSAERLRSVARIWMSDAPSPKRLRILALISQEIGRREDVLDLEGYQAEYGDESTARLVAETAFVVRYRSLS